MGDKRLNIYYQNVRGLRTKTDVFYRNLSCNFYDVVVLTETWLLDGIADSELFDHRYIVWRRDREYVTTGQTRGGGVLIADRRELLAISQPLFCSSAEDLCISMRLRKIVNRTYILTCIYVLNTYANRTVAIHSLYNYQIFLIN